VNIIFSWKDQPNCCSEPSQTLTQYYIPADFFFFFIPVVWKWGQKLAHCPSPGWYPDANGACAGTILTKKNQSTQIKMFTNTILSTKNPTLSALVINPGLRNRKVATNHLDYDVAQENVFNPNFKSVFLAVPGINYYHSLLGGNPVRSCWLSSFFRKASALNMGCTNSRNCLWFLQGIFST
jgi:hypothetical protein